MAHGARRPWQPKHHNSPKDGSRFTTERGSYKGEVKTGKYAIVKDKNAPHKNLVFTDKSRLEGFIEMLNQMKQKL